MPSTDTDVPRFTAIDWDDESSRTVPLRPRTVGFGLALLAVAALFAYDHVYVTTALIGTWNPTRMDWLFLVAAMVTVRYGVVPLVFDRDRTATYVRAFLSHPLGVASFGYLLVLGVVGLVGPDVFGMARVDYAAKMQPPAFTSVYAENIPLHNCVGRVVGEYCHGTLAYPLGTTKVGEDMVRVIVYGMHIGFKLGLSTAVLLVLVATAVGTTAGYAGGWVDDVLMGYVDVQQAIPAIVLYIILATLYLGKGLFALALVFGLFDWGGIARLVRSETLKRRSSGYVRAARAAGASDLHVVRRHVVPNSTATIVTALTRQIPVLILIQVALAYLKLNRVNVRSLGEVLLRGLASTPVPWYRRWWVTVFVVATLAVTVIAFNVFGDVLRDVLDPQEGGN
ncbi:ABC transporter permease [Halobacterium zhouii]|uniref:ABC transporter permease n=1 Tax=Halobacterium zhouii TaxID=2902624 RepID=UPI001E3113B2|nr:ABC transporter permease [Halobacterium zhouii]